MPGAVPGCGVACARGAVCAPLIVLSTTVRGAQNREQLGFPTRDLSGRGAMAAHVLWEHEVVGSNPTAPTTTLVGRAPLPRRLGDQGARPSPARNSTFSRSSYSIPTSCPLCGQTRTCFGPAYRS